MQTDVEGFICEIRDHPKDLGMQMLRTVEKIVIQDLTAVETCEIICKGVTTTEHYINKINVESCQHKRKRTELAAHFLLRYYKLCFTKWELVKHLRHTNT